MRNCERVSVQFQIQLLKSCEDCGYLILNVGFLLDVDQ